ncbi:ABC transporter permease [Actinoplanes sp. CA-142083]|uniref:ABC transporter permease n=1 Tax=Actinoplanes sp. CA-142083 TaxID=3239903 RepID=UPI003D89C2C2
MTITDNGRAEVDEETLTRARELTTGGRLPSKRELQKHLAKGWPVVNEVLTRLGDEARQAAEQRRREARKAMRRLAGRKRPGSGWPVRAERQRTVNGALAQPPPAPAAKPVPARIPEAVQKRPEVAPVTVNEAVRVRRRPRSWPVVLLTAPAFVAIWGGWVDLGRLTGFGVVHPFPGIPGLDGVAVNLAITLPIGLETYAAYALSVWMSGVVPFRARRFARWSAIGSLALGAAGQVAYHLMVAAGMTQAPWQITALVACLPVAVLGLGAALRHLVHAE